MKKYNYLFLLTTLLSLVACQGFFGKKTATDFIQPIDPNNIIPPVAYVPIKPDLPIAPTTQFQNPICVYAGFDNLMYVIDSISPTSSVLYQMDEIGRIQGSKTFDGRDKNVKNIRFVTQDRRLQLICIGRTDTVISGVNYSLATIFRLNLNNNGLLQLNEQTNITQKNIHPFYRRTDGTLLVTNLFSVGGKEAENVDFVSVGVLGDNRYYVARTGVATRPVVGSEERILLFSAQDRFLSPVEITGSGGVLFNDFFAGKRPIALCSFIQPPHVYNLNNPTEDFVVAQLSNDDPIKVRIIKANVAEDAPTSYDVLPVTPNPAVADDFLYRDNKFKNPISVAITGDNANYIFVLDHFKATKSEGVLVDSSYVYPFTFQGLQGARPPAAAISQRLVNVKIGIEGKARSITYSGRTVYVADQTTGKIKRYKLTTDI
jgi:hypothetical protein